MDANLNRRDWMKLFSVAAALTTTLQLPAAEPGVPLFFTKDEFATLDTMTDLIIPSDDHSPGAHEAGVAAYIDKSVAEAFLPEEKSSWRTGLAAVNDLARGTFNQAFSQLGKQQQLELMKTISANETQPQTVQEKFFTQLKQTTAFAYYTSSIGIHQETNYKGNIILEQFVGYMPDAAKNGMPPWSPDK
jgi:hypothetical protein